jgi:hypothetical protein
MITWDLKRNKPLQTVAEFVEDVKKKNFKKNSNKKRENPPPKKIFFLFITNKNRDINI